MTSSTYPSLSFRLLGSTLSSSFSPRLGTVNLTRLNAPSISIDIHTPGLLTPTSRGTIPHLSRDHVKKTAAIDWVHVPFETFLEHVPPVPTLQPGNNPLHTFLGFNPTKHILSMSLRDPADGREITPNGKDAVSALCVRGVRKVSPASYNTYVSEAKPDIVFAMTDIPFTPAPHSEKRIIKSLERSLSWLATLLKLTKPPSTMDEGSHPNVFVHMAGGINDVARDDFATGLLEPLEGPEARTLNPLGLHTLDDGISGYVFDLVPLQTSLNSALDEETTLIPLIHTSLSPLPPSKPRLATSSTSPHQILHLIENGIDLFDAHFAQKAADWGVALDFKFPAPDGPPKSSIGHNLYDESHADEFIPLSSNFMGAAEQTTEKNKPSCSCIACSPKFSSNPIIHSSIDSISWTTDSSESHAPPVTRAYIHHLLHTHEMAAHAMLASHNITILSQFLADIRHHLTQSPDTFSSEIRRFESVYASPLGDEGVLAKAKKQWEEVDLARGKGRMAREKAAKDADAQVIVDQEAAGMVNKLQRLDVAANVADEILGS